ncbi:MAG: ATP12 family protein [Pseudomonadota bacterium]
MTGWAAKRFWTDVSVEPVDQGFEVKLDGRPVRTPGKSPLRLPTVALGRLLAAEWEAQGDEIDPETMPATRMANSAIEKVTPQMRAVADHLLYYGETDLLCYRAEDPKALVAREADLWDPWLDWAAAELGARLVVTVGILPVQQPRVAIAALDRELTRFSAFELAAVHDLVSLPGSLILGLAAARGAADPKELWKTARLDELWQIEQWGEDDLAEASNARKEHAFGEAAEFLRCCRSE